MSFGQVGTTTWKHQTILNNCFFFASTTERVSSSENLGFQKWRGQSLIRSFGSPYYKHNGLRLISITEHVHRLQCYLCRPPAYRPFYSPQLHDYDSASPQFIILRPPGGRYNYLREPPPRSSLVLRNSGRESSLSSMSAKGFISLAIQSKGPRI